MSDSAPALICVIDDDSEVCRGLDSLLRSAGFAVRTFASPDDYLASARCGDAACLMLDIRLDGADGLDFQQQLIDDRAAVPVVLMTGHGDIPMTVRGMKAGAISVLAKPCRADDLLAAAEEAIALDRARRAERRASDDTRLLYETLTPREREVMGLVTAGLLNKQAAGRLGVSEITVKIHRGNLMRKMRAQSLADLVRVADKLGVRDVSASRFSASA